MKMNIIAPNDKGFRFPPEIMSHAVWLSFRFSLSCARCGRADDAERGIVVSYETVRQWCLKFGQRYANDLRRRRPHGGDIWQMDEIFLTIRGERPSLWRAVDQPGNVLDLLGKTPTQQESCSKGLNDVPRVIITDKLKSYGAAKREILPGVMHRQHKGLNNRAENAHQATRLREKKMRRVQSAKQVQRFLAAFGPLSQHFQPARHRLPAGDYRVV